MFSSIKIYFYLAIGIGLFTIAGLAFHNYNKAISNLAIEKANNQTLKNAIQVQQGTINDALSTIDKWQKAQNDLNRAIADMQKNTEEANKQVEELKGLYAKHNLQNLSLKHPEYVQDIINHNSNVSICLLAQASGGKNRCSTSRTKTTDNQNGITQTGTNTAITTKVDSDNTGKPTQR